MNHEQPLPEEGTAGEAGPPKKQVWGWHTLIAVAALIILGALAYQFIREQSLAGPAQLSPVTLPQVAGSEATALADPTSAQAQFEWGNSYAESAQWEQAQAAYQKAIELDPNLQSAYANLGVVYYQLGKLDLAASQYQKALELDANDGDVAYNLGALYVQQALLNSNPPNPDLLQQAVDQLEHASELDPDLAEPYFSLGVAYNALSQKEKAIEAFETFLNRYAGQDPRASQEAQTYLEALRQ